MDAWPLMTMMIRALDRLWSFDVPICANLLSDIWAVLSGASVDMYKIWCLGAPECYREVVVPQDLCGALGRQCEYT